MAATRTTKTTRTASAKAASKERDVLGKLADRGEEALHRLQDLPGGTRAVKAFNDLRERVDELGKKVSGIDRLEARVAKLERELAALKRGAKRQAGEPERKPGA
jgi:hypothetical protein